jgi:hypothetical protein
VDVVGDIAKAIAIAMSVASHRILHALPVDLSNPVRKLLSTAWTRSVRYRELICKATCAKSYRHDANVASTFRGRANSACIVDRRCTRCETKVRLANVTFADPEWCNGGNDCELTIADHESCQSTSTQSSIARGHVLFATKRTSPPRR